MEVGKMKYDAKDVVLGVDGTECKGVDGDIKSGAKSESSKDIHGRITFYYKDGRIITVEDCTKKELENIKTGFIDHGGFNFVSIIKNAFITNYTDVILIKFDEY